MEESLLHYIWKFQLFDHTQLHVDQQPLHILHPGQHNLHSGPDFFNARIRLGKTTWAGNVEIHLTTSDWLKHDHQRDPAYQNVILHVVWLDDRPNHPQLQNIPTLELQNRLSPSLLRKYKVLQERSPFIPCMPFVKQVREITVRTWLERMALERLEEKAQLVLDVLQQTKNDWKEATYRFLCRSFGFGVNAFAFEQLATVTPLNVVEKHRHDLFQLEALLYGQSGLLPEELQEEYPQRLQKEYRFLQHKYGLQPMTRTTWKFMRMRPANFPTVRISQLAMLLHHSPQLHTQVLETHEAEKARQLFNVEASDYWRNHYTFRKEHQRPQAKRLGAQAVERLAINAVAPLLFAYGTAKQKAIFRERALELLAGLNPESNQITQGFVKLDFPNEQALHSQGLLHLKRHYCDKKRCLDCSIGSKLLTTAANNA